VLIERKMLLSLIQAKELKRLIVLIKAAAAARLANQQEIPSRQKRETTKELIKNKSLSSLVYFQFVISAHAAKPFDLGGTGNFYFSGWKPVKSSILKEIGFFREIGAAMAVVADPSSRTSDTATTTFFKSIISFNYLLHASL